MRLGSQVEVLIFGNEEGVAEESSSRGFRHLREISFNEFRTPILSDAFVSAAKLSSAPILCYVNADIIVMEDLISAAKRIEWDRYLMLGRRWNLDVTERMEFSGLTIESLNKEISARGQLHDQSGSDYFVFPKQVDWAMPPFAVGRPGWDNWLIFRARQMEIPVIDASRVVTVVHQNHDYSHVSEGRGGVWEGPEADRNRSLMGGWDHVFTNLDATHLLTKTGLRRPMAPAYLRRRISAKRFLDPRFKPLYSLIDKVRGK